jgi:hypothetical protein
MAANSSEAAAKAGAELLEDEKKFIDLAGSPSGSGMSWRWWASPAMLRMEPSGVSCILEG